MQGPGFESLHHTKGRERKGEKRKRRREGRGEKSMAIDQDQLEGSQGLLMGGSFVWDGFYPATSIFEILYLRSMHLSLCKFYLTKKQYAISIALKRKN